ncbi:TAXI family TRAP transporter solute-binding subunit [Alkalibaculum sporogenes]|uniref:TAXI family TRAP transporter solute-binding subunit n=1 Tax=Alkalibaculum sporogenes TaxID=2655001 RepID=UPI00128CA276|nr:TAXI family TRAP transporter solute-binding subunit [Alkalibaculum sporogenes]
MKKYNIFLVILLLSLFVFTSCSNDGKANEVNSNEVPRVRILTGPSGLTVHTLGSTLSEFVKDSLLITVEPGSTNGNVMTVNSKEAEFGISMTTSVVNGFHGTHFYEDKEKLENIRVIATLWHHYILPITNDEELKHINQLNGTEFTAGPPGGDAEPLAKLLLSYVDLTEEDYTITPYNFSEAAEALKNRQIDLMFAGSPMPNSIHEDLGKSIGGRYINIGKENAEKLVEDYDGLYLVELEEGASGVTLDKPYYTASYRAVLITHKDVSDEDVYVMTKGIYDNFERLGNALGNMRTFPIEDLMSEVGDVPYHNGALQYYQEVGLVKY